MPFPKRLGRFFSLVVLVGSTLILAACGNMMEAPQTTFVAEGSAARDILNLFRPVFWLAVGVFVIVEGLLIWSVIRYRRRPQDGIPLQIHGNTPVEIAWTILPAIIVVGIATMTFSTQARLERVPENPLRVSVIGHQWWWEFQYPDYNNFKTANELHIPAGRDVLFTLTSEDVIHSFWLPRLSGKTDTIPGHSNRLMFRADEVTESRLIRGECAEFCGGTHAQMGMHAVVDPPEVFEAWAQQQQQAAVAPEGAEAPQTGAAGVSATVQAQVDATTGAQPGATATGGETEQTTVATLQAEAPPEPQATDTPTDGGQPVSLEAQGYAVFASKGCVGCHAITGRPDAVGITGPNLTHVGSRQHIVAGWLENTPENMQRWLRDPNGVKPENVMGKQIKLGTLTEDEINALTAYLETLK